ncbi:hypothetical protein GGX14DRAFT_597060 [Mycena pura]|uniref:Uncharacterized protein n=1 Tax=Mycena pura TaxID=153505 RepID=A0AAD6UP97_9AGAR|nr:hypothetical protein GGX14DRAFT_597060 [Mycena pura]
MVGSLPSTILAVLPTSPSLPLSGHTRTLMVVEAILENTPAAFADVVFARFGHGVELIPRDRLSTTMSRKQKSRSGGPIVRKRTSTQHDPRASKRARKENDNPDATDSQSRHGSPSPGPSTSSRTGMPELHDGMSQEQLYLVARQLQAQNNELHHSQQEADRTALGDVTNNTSSDEDEDDDRWQEIHLTKLLWMPDEDAVFEDTLDDNYNPLERFSKEPGTQPQSRIQGAIRDMLDVLPKDYQTPDQLKGFVRTEFLAGMKDQRYVYRNRLRTNPALFDHTILEFSSSDEREKFSESIGRRAKKSKPTWPFEQSVNTSTVDTMESGHST